MYYDNEDEEIEEDDIPDIANENKSHRPYRDNIIIKNEDENNAKGYTTMKVRKPFTESDIRERVKKSLSKTQKQNHRRRVKKGEASYTTKQKKENLNIIKDSW